MCTWHVRHPAGRPQHPLATLPRYEQQQIARLEGPVRHRLHLRRPDEVVVCVLCEPTIDANRGRISICRCRRIRRGRAGLAHVLSVSARPHHGRAQGVESQGRGREQDYRQRRPGTASTCDVLKKRLKRFLPCSRVRREALGRRVEKVFVENQTVNKPCLPRFILADKAEVPCSLDSVGFS